MTTNQDLQEAAERWIEHRDTSSDSGPYWGEDITYEPVFLEGRMMDDLILLATHAANLIAPPTTHDRRAG